MIPLVSLILGKDRTTKKGNSDLKPESGSLTDHPTEIVWQVSCAARAKFIEAAYLGRPGAENFDYTALVWKVQLGVLSSYEALFSKIHATEQQPPRSDSIKTYPLDHAFGLVSNVATMLRTKPDATIDGIFTNFLGLGILNAEGANLVWHIYCRQAIFASIGFLSMLYAPKPQDGSYDMFQIDETVCGNTEIFFCHSQPVDANRKSIAKLMLGFGALLPPPIDLATTKPLLLGSTSFNAYLLSNTANISFRWVDTLNIHLHYDAESQSLCLFRHPCFCVSNLMHNELATPTPILKCCTDLSCRSESWLPISELGQYLREVLLSYRLLFGQNTDSRNMFSSLKPFGNYPSGVKDHVLDQLCHRVQGLDSINLHEKQLYNLQVDFPHFQDRLQTLHVVLTGQNPEGVAGIWRDKRNIVQWYTFWAVIVFGSLGVLLQLAQTITSAIQVANP